MYNIIMATTAAIVLGTLSLDVGIKIVSGVSSSAKNIAGLIGFIKDKGYNNEMVKTLENTDIEATINVINLFIIELDNINSNTPSSLMQCIKNIHQTINDVEDELTKIKTRLEYNKSIKFFSYFRTYGFQNSMKRIQKHKLVLEERWNLLRQTLELKQHLKKDHINSESLFNK
jgi:hypothetical protein